jgi:hypothetical protein
MGFSFGKREFVNGDIKPDAPEKAKQFAFGNYFLGQRDSQRPML